MKNRKWLLFAVAVVAAYISAVMLFGFISIANFIHFGRVALPFAVLFLFVQRLPELFREVPPPRRDYLIACIICLTLSLVGFSLWNEAGRQFGVNTSIFTNPIAGFLSLIAVIGSAFGLVALPRDVNGEWGNRRKLIALGVGLVVGTMVVVVAPLFR